MSGMTGARWLLLAVMIAVGNLSSLATAQAQLKPSRHDIGDPQARSYLWVGNSFFYYNNSMHNHVGAFYRAADPQSKFRSVSVTISGSGIDWHDLTSYFRPDGIGRYSFGPNNEIIFNPPGRQFDAVIIMDCSQCPVHPQLQSIFHDYAKRQSKIAIENKVRPVFFMSWAYKDKPEMTAELAEQYTKAGNDNDALVIPAGLAFARAISGRSDIELYQADKRHPSLLGTYLAAATVYAAFTGKSPENLAYTASIAPDLAAYLRKIAWETVREYYGH